MIFKEYEGDLFSIDDKYYLVHCISTDCSLSAGIAVKFEKKYHLRSKLLDYPYFDRIYPCCILIDKAFNLITKEKYWQKPTYKSLELSLLKLKDLILAKEIKYIAMPRIGCGLDKLNWSKVRNSIQDIFKDTDIEILVCYID